MTTFTGLICNDITEYFQTERQIHNVLLQFNAYTSAYYCGGNGNPDIWSIDDKPIIVAPKQAEFANALTAAGIVFNELNVNIIKQSEDI
jgi:hypothetical protein